MYTLKISLEMVAINKVVTSSSPRGQWLPFMVPSLSHLLCTPSFLLSQRSWVQIPRHPKQPTAVATSNITCRSKRVGGQLLHLLPWAFKTTCILDLCYSWLLLIVRQDGIFNVRKILSQLRVGIHVPVNEQCSPRYQDCCSCCSLKH